MRVKNDDRMNGSPDAKQGGQFDSGKSDRGISGIMVWSTNNIWSQCLVPGIACALLTLSAGCNSSSSTTPATPPAATDKGAATVPHPGKGPKIVVEGGETWEFGSTEVGEEFEHTFVIKNEGTEDLTLKPGHPSCSTCTKFNVDKLLLKPGETANAHVTFHVTAKTAEFRQYAPVETNDPTRSEVKLYVHGKVVERLILSPVGQWNLGDIGEEKPVEFTATLHSALVDKFTIESIKAEHPALTVTTKPMGGGTLKDLASKVGYEIKVVLTPTPEIPVGEFRHRILINVLTPKPVQLKVDAVAQRRGPIRIFGPNWNDDRLGLGAFDPAEPLKVTLNLFTRGIAEDLKIVKVTCPDDRFSFEIVPVPGLKSEKGDHRRYHLLVKVAPSNRPAVYTSKEPLKVSIETNQEKIGQINMKIGCQALPRN